MRVSKRTGTTKLILLDKFEEGATHLERSLSIPGDKAGSSRSCVRESAMQGSQLVQPAVFV